MANKFIGTVDVELQGETYTLRPTIGACIEFEDKVGKTVEQSIQEMAEHKFFKKDVITAIWAGMNGEADHREDFKSRKTWNVVAALVDVQGFMNGPITAAIQFLTAAITPPPTGDEKEVDVEKKN